MRIVITPVAEPQREIDITKRLVAAIAEEIWRACGGNDSLNWLEAERHLAGIVGQARAAVHSNPRGLDTRGDAACAGCPRFRRKGGGRSATDLGTRLLAAARAPADDMAEW